jgi:hypothetical protein
MGTQCCSEPAGGSCDAEPDVQHNVNSGALDEAVQHYLAGTEHRTKQLVSLYALYITVHCDGCQRLRKPDQQWLQRRRDWWCYRIATELSLAHLLSRARMSVPAHI